MEEQIIEELKTIKKLLALIATGDQPQKESISALSRLGFQPKEIAELLGCTPNAVRVALHTIRSKKKANRPKKVK